MEGGIQDISLYLTFMQLYDGNGGGRTCTDTQWSLWWAGVRRRNKPPLYPIPVQRQFQIVGLDIMETEQGNRYVIVFQDFMTI